MWEIADAITRETGRLARRAEVIGRYQQEGGNANTASTQYHYWKASHAAESKPTASADASQAMVLHVKEAGRVIIPAELRTALNIAEGDALSARVVDGEMRLMPLATAVSRAQALVRQFVPAGVGLVDELIVDRRVKDGQ